jgi:cob(I)alamin adenosyltransferase
MLPRVKIYTRTGDDGTTGLLGPGRVLKSSPRVEAYGSVDELNAVIGTVRALDHAGWLADELGAVQSRLFSVGAELAATTPEPLATLERVADSDIAALEQLIDRLKTDLTPPHTSALPSSTPLAAQLPLARTVCRRAERRVVGLAEAESIEPRLTRYLNRLADALFVMARWCNRKAGVAEVEWRAGGRI